jgi:hypothetical protein
MTAQTPNSFFDHSPVAQRAKKLGKLGDRTKLARQFFADLYTAWQEQGEAALARAAFHDPMGFSRMVALLMPQKLEITHPTDGMTDERLADLLELAERMAALKASGHAPPALLEAEALRLTDEKTGSRTAAAQGGGGPECVSPARGEGGPSTSRDAAAAKEAELHNGLETPRSEPDSDDGSESTYAIQPPVGKPFPTLEHDEKRANVRKLREDDIDPASLF